MPDKIPDIEALPEPVGSQLDVEARLLEISAQVQGLLSNERTQRIRLKWISATVGLLSIGGMSLLLWHVMHHIFAHPSGLLHPTVAIAFYIGPIISITTITVTLFIASFRRFEDKDLEAAGAGLVGGIGIARGG
jgi:hypothetical protein